MDEQTRSCCQLMLTGDSPNNCETRRLFNFRSKCLVCRDIGKVRVSSTSAITSLIRTYSEETANQRSENFLGALSNSGPAVRLYSEGRAPAHPKTVRAATLTQQG
jgi:hypothetical protein